jgi:neutral ceramidase
MLGYGKAYQQSAGIHLRLRSRAFVIVDADSGQRLLIVVNELPLMFDSVHREVLRGLRARYGDSYTETNVMITATHTHCWPGGYSDHRLYNSTTHGFREKTYAAIIVRRVRNEARPIRPGEPVGGVELGYAMTVHSQ